MTTYQIIAKYRFIADAMDAGKELEYSIPGTSPEEWFEFDPQKCGMRPIWNYRIKEQTPSPHEAWEIVSKESVPDLEPARDVLDKYVKSHPEIQLAWHVFWWMDYHDGYDAAEEMAKRDLDAHFAAAEPELVKPKAVKFIFPSPVPSSGVGCVGNHVGPVPTSENPPFVVGWIAAEYEPLIDRLHVVWGDRESIKKPLPVVTLDVVEALEKWRQYFGDSDPGIVASRNLLAALTRKDGGA